MGPSNFYSTLDIGLETTAFKLYALDRYRPHSDNFSNMLAVKLFYIFEQHGALTTAQTMTLDHLLKKAGITGGLIWE